MGVKKWAVHVIHGMYMDVRSRVRVNPQYRWEFETGRNLGLDSVCIRDLFLFSAPCFSYLCWKPYRASSGELLYVNDLVEMTDSLEECTARLKVWKEGMEHKGHRVNMKNTNHGLGPL